MRAGILLLLASLCAIAQAHELHQHVLDAQNNGSGTLTDQCGSTVIQDYNMPLRIGSFFIILGTSSLGIFSPMLFDRLKGHAMFTAIKNRILMFAKFFGTGVILATAFIHMLPSAFSSFSSPCLPSGWNVYGAWAGLFCMISAFFIQGIELAAITNADRYLLSKADGASRRQLTATDGSLEEGKQPENEGHHHTHDHDSSSEELDNGNGIVEPHATLGCGHRHGNDDDVTGHYHSAGLLESEEAFKKMSTLLLELGITIHSVIIGITLSNTGTSEFSTLLCALVFHQFFEGMALGTRINELSYKNLLKPILLGFIYVLTTPLGIAIGIGIHQSFNGSSPSAILTTAILDSMSAGILLYNSFVELMSMEMNHSMSFRMSPWQTKLVCFLAMYIGATAMAIVGIWA